MKKYYIIFLFLFRNGITNSYGQETPFKHKIAKGETIEVIAKKYGLSPSVLYQLNPGLSSGFNENDLIIISKNGNGQTNNEPVIIYHTVLPNETKYGLSKKYNISIAELERQNPHIISMLQKGHELKIEQKINRNNYASKGNSQAHIVQKGETLWELSRVYKVTVNQLIEENKANLGIYLQIGQALIIPVKKQELLQEESAEMDYHIVEAGETKYGLSKRYGISINELENLNPHIVSMLMKGHKISIPNRNGVQPTNTSSVNTVVAINTAKNQGFETHIVAAGETKFELSKKYNIAISELESINPQIVDGLKTGQEINVPIIKTQSLNEDNQAVKSQTNIEKPLVVQEETASKSELQTQLEGLVTYEVKPQETLYGLSKMTGLSTERLTELNPELSNGLKTGMLLKIPSENLETLTKAKENLEEISQVGLIKSLKIGDEKEIAFLLPFAEEKYRELIKSAKKNAKSTDAFFEFYAGATMAIDSLKKNNVLIKTKIIKIDELKTAEENFSDIVKFNVQNSKIIFAPSQDYYSEALGNYMAENNIPMIISDSKGTSIAGNSTYTSLTSNIQLRKLILDYITAQNENIIIVSAPSRKQNKDFISKYYPQARFVTISESGILDSESLRNLLSATKKNYVVLDSDKSGLILETTTILLKESSAFNVQLVLIEPKENVIGEGLSDMRFRALKMIYPSVSNPNESKQLTKFKKDFTSKFGYPPSQESIKGFDITFDGLLRLFQDKEFEKIAKESATEQIHLKFKYLKNLEKGFFNSAGYILQFEEGSDSKIIN